MTAISVCVCTFRRPDALLRLLRSLGRLDSATPRHEVIVVDNDAGRSGEAPVEQARAEGLDVRYLVEPIRGIARARNRSLEPAAGEYVAFIDDDEEADPEWLLELWYEVIRHGADGGLGPVIPRFDDRTPRWLIDGRFFERPRPPTGTILEAKQTRTGNALIRRRPLMAHPGPFDERFDFTGGEDGDLFARLIAGGCRIIAVDSAVVHEHLTLARASVPWLLQKRFLGGIGAARLYAAAVPPASRRRWQRLRPLASGIALSAAGLLVFPASRTRGLSQMVLGAQQLGVFAFHSGFSFRPYRRDSWR